MSDSNVTEKNTDQLVPVTVLTGYLGAGKTTLLNHILTAQHGKKYAVIINEFGELGVDNDLVVDADEEIFEMNNGCVCCTIRGDLVRILESLMKRRHKFDGIIVETTGLADPAPVAQTFFVDEDVRSKCKLDAVVTVVDAKNVMQTLDDSKEAVSQVAFADVILLNKTDLVDKETLLKIESRLKAINPFAQIHRTEKGNIALDKVLKQGGFDLQHALSLLPEFLENDHDDAHHHHDHEHHHDTHLHHEHGDGITSISLTINEPLDATRFNSWIMSILQQFGMDLLRTKGILNLKGMNERFAFQAVHMMADGDFIGPWKAGETRNSRLVFIGRNIQEKLLKDGFERCRA